MQDAPKRSPIPRSRPERHAMTAALFLIALNAVLVGSLAIRRPS
jgi:hypothetical protein